MDELSRTSFNLQPVTITMSDTDADKLQALLRDELHSETSKIAWSELQRFFAAGKAIYVSDKLDLIETAVQISADNSEQVRRWMNTGMIAPVSDGQARQWIDSDATVWAVVVKPWILVQDVKENRSGH